MDTLRQDLRFAWRSLMARRGFTAVAFVTLGLGIGATTAMFSIVRGVLLRPLPYEESDRIIVIHEVAAGEGLKFETGYISHPDFLDVQSQTSQFESSAQVDASNLTVTGESGAAELIPGAHVTPDFFRVFRARPIKGREFTAEEDRYNGPAVAIISEGYWRDRLGTRPDVIGSTIRISGRAHEIVGVVPADLDYPDHARIWLPNQNDDEGCGRGCVTRGAVARLAPGKTVESARAELAALGTRLAAEYPESNTDKTFTALTLRDVTVGDVRPALWLLFGAVGMVLLIACANVANLLLVQAQARLTEIAIRSTLGADRRRLLRQLMTESILLSVLGGLAGVVLAMWSVDVVLSFAPSNLPRLGDVHLDGTTLGFASLLVLSTATLFGLAPALSLSRINLARSLREGGRGRVGGQTDIGRSAILVVEVALSVMLLTGAGLMVRSLVRLTDVRPGFEPAGVTVFRLSLPRARYAGPADRVLFMDRLQSRLAAMPGVDEVAFMVAPPLSDIGLAGGFTRTDLPAPEAGKGPGALYRVVSPGALEMLHVPLVSGRYFEDTDRHDAQPVVMISQALADEYFRGVDPIGRQMDVQISAGFDEDVPRTVVGVFGDIRGTRISSVPEPEMIVPYAQSGASFPHVLIRGREPGALLEAARREVQAIDAELPLVQPGTMDQWVSSQLAQPRFYLALLTIFAGLAILLAAVGMYGVVATIVSRRRQEIGLRMALGARVQQVIRLVLWQGLRPALAGIVIGGTAAYWATALIRGMLFEVAPQDPLTFALVPLLLTAVVMAACGVPAHRAARIPPASALRDQSFHES